MALTAPSQNHSHLVVATLGNRSGASRNEIWPGRGRKAVLEQTLQHRFRPVERLGLCRFASGWLSHLWLMCWLSHSIALVARSKTLVVEHALAWLSLRAVEQNRISALLDTNQRQLAEKRSLAHWFEQFRACCRQNLKREPPLGAIPARFSLSDF